MNCSIFNFFSNAFSETIGQHRLTTKIVKNERYPNLISVNEYHLTPYHNQSLNYWAADKIFGTNNSIETFVVISINMSILIQYTRCVCIFFSVVLDLTSKLEKTNINTKHEKKTTNN